MMPESGQWFNLPGPEMDVAVSSRARLSRNLMGYLFPPLASKDQEEMAGEEVLKAFQKLPGGFKIVSLDSISPLERRILMERNLISQELSASPNKVVAISEDEKLSA